MNKKRINLSNNAKIKFFSFILFILIFILLSQYFNLGSYFDINVLREKVKGFGSLGVFVFILLFALGVIFFVPLTLLIIGAGILFGTFFGSIYSIIAGLLGAVISFFASNFFAKDYVGNIIENKFPKASKFKVLIESNQIESTLLLRFIPIFPFSVANYSFGLFKMDFWKYLFIAFVWLIPNSLIVAYFGSSLSKFDIESILISSLLFVSLLLFYPIYKFMKKKS